MPNYEAALILRLMSRPEVVATLKRTAGIIFGKGGIIRKIDNLGTSPLPYKINNHGAVHRKGSYFVYTFICPPSAIADIEDEYGRDVDIVRRRIFKVENPDEFECTLDDEMQPAPYRKDVQELLARGPRKDKFKKEFKYNTGLDYNPFQK